MENGKAAIWVRWSGPGPNTSIVPPGVEVIYVDTRGTRADGAEPVEDLRVAPTPGGLSGASRALLAALYPAEPPAEDEGWTDEKTIWARVAALTPRLGLILRCRFGDYGPRPLTLARTAEVVADAFDMDEVTRERFRQLQAMALRQLRARSQGVRAPPAKGRRRTASAGCRGAEADDA